MAKKFPKKQESVKKAGFHSIGATIRQESRCVPYAGFFLPSYYSHLQMLKLLLTNCKKIPKGKVKKRTLVSDLTILALKVSKIAA